MSTAKKNKTDKPDLSLIPYAALEAMARAMMDGETKYGRYNYFKGHKISDLIAAAIRHLVRFMEGEDFAPDSGVHHLGHGMANCLMILKQIELGTSIDDRPSKEAIDILAPLPEPDVYFNVVAESERSKSGIVIATYVDEHVAKHMAETFHNKDWPKSSFNLVIKKVYNDRYQSAS